MMFNKRQPVNGFSLIELLVAIAIVGIIATIAMPTYTSFVSKSNRTEGQRELLKMANLQEQYFADNRKYTPNLSVLGFSSNAVVTESGYYQISATTTNNHTQFTLTAQALNAQAVNDSECKQLTVTETGKKSATSENCWD
ncbi:type IV pilin protein [Thalassotalea aquiviva]|uniref:type IV pilin protein n=1 Tax=Thalassotalea aquiviva TaxID=3242415 RepID=UPI00352B4124